MVFFIKLVHKSGDMDILKGKFAMVYWVYVALHLLKKGEMEKNRKGGV